VWGVLVAGLIQEVVVVGAFEAAPVPMEVRPSTNGSRKGSTSLRTSTIASRKSRRVGPGSHSRYMFIRSFPVIAAQMDDGDGWGDMDPVHEDAVIPEVKITKPIPAPKPKSQPKSIPVPVITNVDAPIEPARAQSPAVSIPEKPATPPVNLASMSKEEKEKEMARRREERKAVSQNSLLMAYVWIRLTLKNSDVWFRLQKIAAMKAGKKA
jgi:hypothetical protein